MKGCGRRESRVSVGLSLISFMHNLHLGCSGLVAEGLMREEK